jgi:hypothetical protein
MDTRTDRHTDGNNRRPAVLAARTLSLSAELLYRVVVTGARDIASAQYPVQLRVGSDAATH